MGLFRKLTRPGCCITLPRDLLVVINWAWEERAAGGRVILVRGVFDMSILLR